MVRVRVIIYWQKSLQINIWHYCRWRHRNWEFKFLLSSFFVPTRLLTRIHTHTESDECKRVQFSSLLSPLRSYVKRIKNKDFAIAEIRTINLRVSRQILTPRTTVPRQENILPSIHILWGCSRGWLKGWLVFLWAWYCSLLDLTSSSLFVVLQVSL